MGKRATRADKESSREAMDRYYEVDIGDRAEIDTHDEGTVQGEVTSMLWREEVGFRQPALRWTNSTGEQQMGKIEMWEPWRIGGSAPGTTVREGQHNQTSLNWPP